MVMLLAAAGCSSRCGTVFVFMLSAVTAVGVLISAGHSIPISCLVELDHSENYFSYLFPYAFRLTKTMEGSSILFIPSGVEGRAKRVS